MKYIKAVIVALVLFGLFAWLVGSYLAPDDLKKCKYSAPSTAVGCEPADVIIAISGGDTGARADEAIKLYKAGWAPYIIFSGAAADKSGPSNAAVMKQRAIDAGIDPSVIIVEELSESTEQNASKTSSIITEKGYKSAILVTSPYHQRRALLEFDRRALSVDVRAHPTTTDSQWSALWWLTVGGWLVAIPELVVSLILSTGGVVR